MERSMKKIKFGQEVFYGPTPDDVPYVQLSPLDEDIIVSYTGPDNGLIYAEAVTETSETSNGNPSPVAGCKTWSRKEPQAYGICISLYEQHPISMKMSGEPIADSFAICARRNNTILLIADGVNWGEKSRLAARCALYGSMKYLNYKIFDKHQHPATTQDMMALLRKSLDEAHRAILAREGGLTTLCACMVAPVQNSDQHAVCCVNVGDSYAFVYSHNQGIREVTVGSHDVASERDIRDAGGALGPVDGQNPELHNLTCAVTFCHRGDIVFLSTDGVSDNFDPVVTKLALPQKPAGDANLNKNSPGSPNGSSIVGVDDKPAMSPKERHVYSLKEMERVVHEYELLTEEMCSAQEFCSAMVQHVLTVTDGKRKILENPALYAKRKMTQADRKRRDTEIVEKMSKAPGKLDHASIVAVEVCGFLVKEEEEEEGEVEVAGDTDNSATVVPDQEALSRLTSPTSPTSPSVTPKKSGARKLLSKLKNLPSPTSSASSPTSSSPPSQPHQHLSPKSPLAGGAHRQPQSSPLALHLSPRKFHKRGRQRFNSQPETPASPTIPESPFESEACVVSPVRGVVPRRRRGGGGRVASCGNGVADCSGPVVVAASPGGRVVASPGGRVASPDGRRPVASAEVASPGGRVASPDGRRPVASAEVASPAGDVAPRGHRRTSHEVASNNCKGVASPVVSPDHGVTSPSRRQGTVSGRIVASPRRRPPQQVASPVRDTPSSGRIVPSPVQPVFPSSQASVSSRRMGGPPPPPPHHLPSSNDGGASSHRPRDPLDGVDLSFIDGRPSLEVSEVSGSSLASSSAASSPVSPVFVDPSSPSSEGPLRLRSRSRRSQVVSQCIAVESAL